MFKKVILASLVILSPFAYTTAAYSSGKTYNELVNSSEVLQAGTVIPSTLLTPVISDNMTTTIIAVVRQDVFDSVTGENLLIPAG